MSQRLFSDHSCWPAGGGGGEEETEEEETEEAPYKEKDNNRADADTNRPTELLTRRSWIPEVCRDPPSVSDMETKHMCRKAEEVEMPDSDLSELIKEATKLSHERAENTQLMLSYQRGQVTLLQYKMLLASLHHVYVALEEELDRNRLHPQVEPIYFPAELARRQLMEADLEHLHGPTWRAQLVVPRAAHRYAHRLRQIGKENPEFLVAHAYTRYLGDLSGGQVLGRITQKSLGLQNGEGTAFFTFPGVSSPNRFKQLYRSRMNSVELTEQQRAGLLEEAVLAFELNIQLFDGLQETLTSMEREADLQTHTLQEMLLNGAPQSPSALLGSRGLCRALLGVCVALATVCVGLYAF